MKERKYKFKVWKYGIGFIKRSNQGDNIEVMKKINLLEEKIKDFEIKLNQLSKIL